MATLNSRWPGKCRRCHSSHLAGDVVWWEKGFKGVLCMKCHTGQPSEPSRPVPNEEDDDLKKPKPETLKVGHALHASSATNLMKMFGCAFHDPDVCDCPGCIMKRGRLIGGLVERLDLPAVFVASSIQYVSCVLYPGASLIDRRKHLDNGSMGYRVQFTFRRPLSPDSPICVETTVPLHYIQYGPVREISGLVIVPGAPRPDMIRTEPIRGRVKYLGGTIHGHDSTGNPEGLIVPVEGAKIIDCRPIDNYEDGRKLIGATMTSLRLRNGQFLGGCSSYHTDQTCDCSGCDNMRTFTLERKGTERYNVTSAVYSGGLMRLSLAKSGEEGDYEKAIAISFGADMTTIRLAAESGLAFTTLDESLVLSGGSQIPSEPVPSNPDLPTPIFMGNGEIRPKEATVVTESLNEAANSLIAALQASAVPEARVREIALETVAGELKKLPVKNHKIKFNDGAPIEFEGIMHGMATEIAEAIVSGFHNVMVVGPAGSGKTYLFSQVATLLQKQMGWDESDYKASMSCAPGQTESMFIGRMIPSLTTGTETYHGTNLTRLYSKPTGGAFLFDEISNSEPTVMNLVNSMIALDGHVTLPDGRILERPAKMVVFAADNTWGQGGDRMYIRNQLDAATLDRFTGAKFFMDYDDKLELALCPIQEVYAAVKSLREKVTSLKLRRIVSTRAFSAAQRMGSNGMKTKEILKRLTIDWSENDRKSAGA